MSFIDSAIERISPAFALRREIARRKLFAVRAFEGASLSPRMDRWGLASYKDTYKDRKYLRQRARYLVDNNPYAARALATLSSYTIGKGIIPHIDDSAKAISIFERSLKHWADSEACDVEGYTNLYGLQALIVKNLIVDGEVFVQRVFDKSAIIPIKLRLIEASKLDETKSTNDGKIQHGIEYAGNGQIAAYWFASDEAQESKRVDADDIAHVFRKDRAGQSRGVSWFAPILTRLKDFDDFEDAELLRQKLSASIVGVFRDLEAQGDDFGEKSSIPKEIKPGSIFEAPAGQTIEFFAPPAPAGSSAYITHIKMTLAIGLGIPYMLLAGDYSNSNFSSSRLSMLNFYKYIDQIQSLVLIPTFCNPVARWFEEACSLKMQAPPLKMAWTPPKKDLTDPIKEIEAMRRTVEAGFCAHQDVIRELGEDPEDVYQRIDTSNKLIDQKGFSFSTDYRNKKEFQGENKITQSRS